MERVIRLVLVLQLFCHWFVIFQSELLQGTVMQHCFTPHSLQIVCGITYISCWSSCLLSNSGPRIISSGLPTFLGSILHCIFPFHFSKSLCMHHLTPFSKAEPNYLTVKYRKWYRTALG